MKKNFKLDIKIKNGHIIDPYNDIDEVYDIDIYNNKIVEISKNIDKETNKTIDVSGCYVFPGLIDYHAHVAPLCEIGVEPEVLCFTSGVTTIVDAGSSGCANYESYRSKILDSKVRIKAYLNVCSAGLVTSSYGENIDPRYFNRKKIKYLFEKYPDELVALKIRMDKNLSKDMGIYPLEETIRLAEEMGVRVVVHTTNAQMPQADIAKILRCGDVFTHMYHNFDNSIISENGEIIEEVKEARDRGVIFDSANARFHFAFSVAKPAIEKGFLPDIISTDITKKSIYKKPQIFNMAFLISKYLNMGLDLKMIVKLSAVNPAKLLGMEDQIGQLGKGAIADISIFKIEDKKIHFEDWEGGILEGDRLLKNVMTIKDGEIVYHDIDFN